MSVYRRILSMWGAPFRTARAVIDAPPSEPQALATLMAGAFLAFVAQLPGHARAAHLAPDVPLDARVGGAILGGLFFLPLLAYLLAGATQLGAWLAGWRPEGVRMRMALFWAFLAVAPAMLLAGLVQGLIGPGPALTLVHLITGLGFVLFWVAGLRAAVQTASDSR